MDLEGCFVKIFVLVSIKKKGGGSRSPSSVRRGVNATAAAAAAGGKGWKGGKCSDRTPLCHVTSSRGRARGLHPLEGFLAQDLRVVFARDGDYAHDVGFFAVRELWLGLGCAGASTSTSASASGS